MKPLPYALIAPHVPERFRNHFAAWYGFAADYARDRMNKHDEETRAFDTEIHSLVVLLRNALFPSRPAEVAAFYRVVEAISEILPARSNGALSALRRAAQHVLEQDVKGDLVDAKERLELFLDLGDEINPFCTALIRGAVRDLQKTIRATKA